MKPDYQFDDTDTALPLWKVKHQDVRDRAYGMPFFKQSNIARAASRLDAISKVKAAFPAHDRFSATKLTT